MDEGVSFGDFVGEEVIASNSPRSVLKRAFGSFEDSVDCSVPLRAPDFPLSWVTRLDSAVMKRGGIAETLLLQAVGVRNNESEGRTKSNNNDCCLTLIDRLRVLKVFWKRDEDTTVGELCERGGLDDLMDCVFVDCDRDELVPHCQHCNSLGQNTTLSAEPRLRFMMRTMPHLLDRVAEAERFRRIPENSPLLYAWRVVFDAGTFERERGESHCLVSETTRLDGVRYVPGSLMKSGDLRGVAVFRKLLLVGVVKMAWLIHVLFSDCSPHLVQIGKISGPDDSTQVVLMQQKPLFYRSLHDVLLEPRSSLRAKIDPDQLSSLITASLLSDMASCRPSSVFLYLNSSKSGEEDSFGVEIGVECLDTALQPFATSSGENGEEFACVCNILWMLESEMSCPVSASVRDLWARLDCEKVTLMLLEKCSSFNDQMQELFLPAQMSMGATVVPLLLRTGVATNLLNKAMRIQAVLKQDGVTHKDLFRAVLPELSVVYDVALARAKGNVLDTWRLLTRRSHVVNMDGISLPDYKTGARERAQVICGENVFVPLDRLKLRKAVEREQSAVKLVAEVLKSLNT